MNLEQVRDFLLADEQFRDSVAFQHSIDPKQAQFEDMPPGLNAGVRSVLAGMGINQLYSHQRRSFDHYQEGKNFVVTTPTASGKTLSYLLPILQDKVENPHGRHLFMFPTKALAQDELALFRKWQSELGVDWNVNTFDGDTPPQERRIAKKAGDFVLTNPDMLHSGILPHHTTWKNLFENLRTIVIDEMHTYLGVFGSNVANVLRRLNRILEHHGANPRFIFCSATIANPVELAENLSGQKFEWIGESGAPEGKKHFVFYNPPIIDEAGNRQSPYRAAANLGEVLLKNQVPTIFFARSRIRVELLVSLIQERLPWHLKNKVRGYRGGYLPLERRNIEKGLRNGELLGVVSTNALELGIDIGMLQAVVSVGYPGRISSLFQQFGRAGRKKEGAMAIMVATPGALDQYLMNNPDFVLDSKGEAAIVNPENLMIYMQHLKCAAYEMRFQEGDDFGEQSADEYLNFLVDSRLVLHKGGKFLWIDESYPASEISLRSAARDNFVIVDQTQKGQEKVIGEVDYFSAPTMIHSEAIYIHQGKHFYVDELKWDERRAEVSEVKSDYYTDAHQKVNLNVINQDEVRALDGAERLPGLQASWGEITVSTKAYLYKKIKMATSENLGWGEIHTPEIEMHTQAAWLEFDTPTDLPAYVAGQLLSRLAYVLKQMAPLVALCDQGDIQVMGFYRDNQFKDCSVVLYDRFPGGVGLAFKLMRSLPALLEMAEDAVSNCECELGCPSCIGVWDVEHQPMGDDDEGRQRTLDEFPFKGQVLSLVRTLLGAGQGRAAELAG